MKKLFAIMFSVLLIAALVPASAFADSQSVTLNTSYNTTVNRDGTSYITVTSQSNTKDGYTLEIVPGDDQISVVSGNSGVINSTDVKTTIFEIKAKASADIGAHKITIEARSSEIDIYGNSLNPAPTPAEAITDAAIQTEAGADAAEAAQTGAGQTATGIGTETTSATGTGSNPASQTGSATTTGAGQASTNTGASQTGSATTTGAGQASTNTGASQTGTAATSAIGTGSQPTTETSTTPSTPKLLQAKEVNVMVVDNTSNYYGPAQTATNVSYTLSNGDSIDAKAINSLTVTFFNRSNVMYRNCELSLTLPTGMTVYSGAGSVYVGNVGLNKTATASFPIVCSDTLKDGSYEITATLNGGYYDYSGEYAIYVDSKPLTQKFYVPVTNGYVEEEEEEEETTSTAIDVAKPILMVSNYSCGGSIVAGKNFGLNLTLLNTSNVLLKNIKVTVDPVTGIVPVGSSNSFYIESIDAGATYSKTLNFASDRSMNQGYYSISVGMSYEDPNKTGYSSSDTVSVQVVQESRLVVDDILDPGWLTMSDQGYASVSYRNMGNNTINNLQIYVEGDFTMDSGASYFAGNMASGKQDSYSFNFWPNQAGECNGRITFSYEDADGEEHYLYKEFCFNIGEGYSYEEDPGEYIEPEPQGFVMPTWGWPAVGFGALIILIIIVKIVKKHKAKKQEALDLDE